MRDLWAVVRHSDFLYQSRIDSGTHYYIFSEIRCNLLASVLFTNIFVFELAVFLQLVVFVVSGFRGVPGSL